MPYGLKRLLEIKAEREAKKAEKARLKKEKEEEKKRQKKLEHKKKLISKHNKKAYAKRRKVELDRRKAMGDEYAYFSVYITKNRKRKKYLGAAWWKTDAYKIYSEAIEENRKSIGFAVNGETKLNVTTRSKEPVKYEILLVKKIKEGESNVSSFRNEDGKFIDSVILDDDEHVIVNKDIWYVEEKFNVYGHHPTKDKKDYHFILNKMLLNHEDTGDEMKRVIVYNNKLIIQRIDDFDFVICRDNEQCSELYNKLEKDIAPLKKKYIVFMGQIPTEMSDRWLDKIQEKTGWARQSCRRINNLY